MTSHENKSQITRQVKIHTRLILWKQRNTLIRHLIINPPWILNRLDILKFHFPHPTYAYSVSRGPISAVFLRGPHKIVIEGRGSYLTVFRRHPARRRNTPLLQPHFLHPPPPSSKGLSHTITIAIFLQNRILTVGWRYLRFYSSKFKCAPFIGVFVSVVVCGGCSKFEFGSRDLVLIWPDFGQNGQCFCYCV